MKKFKNMTKSEMVSVLDAVELQKDNAVRQLETIKLEREVEKVANEGLLETLKEARKETKTICDLALNESVPAKIKRMLIVSLSNGRSLLDFAVDLSTFSSTKAKWSDSFAVDSVSHFIQPKKYRVVLDDVGARRVDVVKAIRSLYPCSLQDAANITKSNRPTVLGGISLSHATDIKQQLEDAGATVDIFEED